MFETLAHAKSLMLSDSIQFASLAQVSEYISLSGVASSKSLPDELAANFGICPGFSPEMTGRSWDTARCVPSESPLSQDLAVGAVGALACGTANNLDSASKVSSPDAILTTGRLLGCSTQAQVSLICLTMRSRRRVECTYQLQTCGNRRAARVTIMCLESVGGGARFER